MKTLTALFAATALTLTAGLAQADVRQTRFLACSSLAP